MNAYRPLLMIMLITATALPACRWDQRNHVDFKGVEYLLECQAVAPEKRGGPSF
jgi:hypothetical protein